MLTNDIRPETTLIVDWSVPMGYPDATKIAEYNTTVVPFLVYQRSEYSSVGRWRETGYKSLADIEIKRGDVIWSKDHSNDPSVSN